MRAPLSGWLLGIFGAGRHQARHFGLGDRDFLAAVVRELDVGDGVIVRFAHERGGLGHGRRSPCCNRPVSYQGGWKRAINI